MDNDIPRTAGRRNKNIAPTKTVGANLKTPDEHPGMLDGLLKAGQKRRHPGPMAAADTPTLRPPDTTIHHPPEEAVLLLPLHANTVTGPSLPPASSIPRPRKLLDRRHQSTPPRQHAKYRDLRQQRSTLPRELLRVSSTIELPTIPPAEPCPRRAVSARIQLPPIPRRLRPHRRGNVSAMSRRR